MDIGDRDPEFRPKGEMMALKCNINDQDRIIVVTGSIENFVNEFYGDPNKIQTVNEISLNLGTGKYVWLYLELKDSRKIIIVKKFIDKLEIATNHSAVAYIYNKQNDNNVRKILFAGELEVTKEGTEDTKENSKKRKSPEKKFIFNVLSGTYSAELCKTNENYYNNITVEITHLLKDTYKINNIEIEPCGNAEDNPSIFKKDTTTCSNLNTYINAGLKVYAFPNENLLNDLRKLDSKKDTEMRGIFFIDNIICNVLPRYYKGKDLEDAEKEENEKKKEIEKKIEEIDKKIEEIDNKYLLKEPFPEVPIPSLFGKRRSKRRSRRRSKRRSRRRSRKVLGNNLRKKEKKISAVIAKGWI